MKKAQRHMRWLGTEDFASCHVRTIAESDFVREYVGGSGWKDAENHGICRARVSSDAVDRFVDCAIAAGGEYTLATLISGLRRNVSGRIRTRGGEEFDVIPGAFENLSRTVEPGPFRPLQPARKRVENNANSLE